MKPRGWLALAGAGVAVVILAVVALAASGGDDDPPGIDCSTFRVTPQLWAAAGYDRRLQLRGGLEGCGRLDGQPDTQVIALLGPPDANGANEIDYDLPFPDGSDRQVWRIHLDADARVKSTELRSPGADAP